MQPIKAINLGFKHPALRSKGLLASINNFSPNLPEQGGQWVRQPLIRVRESEAEPSEENREESST